MSESKTELDKYMIGITIVLLREKYGISQTDMIAHVGITRVTWIKIEQGTRPINIDELNLVLRKFDNMTYNNFFEEVEKNSKQLVHVLEQKSIDENISIDTILKLLLMAGIGSLIAFFLQLLKKK